MKSENRDTYQLALLNCDLHNNPKSLISNTVSRVLTYISLFAITRDTSMMQPPPTPIKTMHYPAQLTLSWAGDSPAWAAQNTPEGDSK